MRKKIVGLLLVAMLAGMLAGCGDTASSVENSNDTAAGNIESTESEESSEGVVGEEVAVTETEAKDDPTKNLATEININYSDTNPIGKVIDEALGISDEVFAGTGVKINWISGLGTGAETLAAMAGGSVDFAGIGPLPVVTSYGNGIQEFKIVAFNGATEGDQIIAHSDSGISSLEDLKGKKIGVSVGTTRMLTLLNALDSVGLSSDDVELVNLGNGAWAAAYEAGEVDADCAATSQTSSYVDSGEAVELFTSGEEINPIVARTEFLEENPDLAAKVIKVWQRIYEYVVENPEEAAALVAEANGQNPDAIAWTYERTVYRMDQKFTDDDLQSLEDIKNFALDQELITEDFDLADAIDFTYLEMANELD